MSNLNRLGQNRGNVARVVAWIATATTLVAGAATTQEGGQASGGAGDWPLHNRDLGSGRYSSLDAINTSNVGRLALAWQFDAGAEHSIRQVTPVVVDGVMYLNAGGTTFALDAASGQPIWTRSLDEGLAARGRGPGYGNGRVYAFGGTTVYATDATTDELVESFGDRGRLAIVSEALQFKYPDDYPPNVDATTLGYQLRTPPVYFNDTLYMGATVSENNIPGGLVMAADATTVAIRWVFNTVLPRPKLGVALRCSGPTRDERRSGLRQEPHRVSS